MTYTINDFIKGLCIIKCKTKEQTERLLFVLEKYSYLSWISYKNPTEYNPWGKTNPEYIIIAAQYGLLSYGEEEDFDNKLSIIECEEVLPFI